MFYADVNTLGGSVHATKKNTKALVVAGKEIGLEVNADKTKYMAMSRDQNGKELRSSGIDRLSQNVGKILIINYHYPLGNYPEECAVIGMTDTVLVFKQTARRGLEE